MINELARHINSLYFPSFPVIKTTLCFHFPHLSAINQVLERFPGLSRDQRSLASHRERPGPLPKTLDGGKGEENIGSESVFLDSEKDSVEKRARMLFIYFNQGHFFFNFEPNILVRPDACRSRPNALLAVHWPAYWESRA